MILNRNKTGGNTRTTTVIVSAAYSPASSSWPWAVRGNSFAAISARWSAGFAGTACRALDRERLARLCVAGRAAVARCPWAFVAGGVVDPWVSFVGPCAAELCI